MKPFKLMIIISAVLITGCGVEKSHAQAFSDSSVYPADRQAMEDDRWREHESKTYNEQQISDDFDTYPIQRDKGTQNYTDSFSWD